MQWDSLEAQEYRKGEHSSNQKNSYGHYMVLFMLILICAVWIFDVRSEDEDFIAVDPALMQTTLVEYGYPQVVINVLSEGTKLRIYEEKIHFDSAQICYYRESGEKLYQISIWGETKESQAWSEKNEPLEYDLALALVTGFCYEGSEMHHAMCSLNYRWESMPEIKKEDYYQMRWKPNQMWVIDDSFCWDLSELRKDEIRTLRYDKSVAGAWGGGMKWYAELEDLGRLGIRGIRGGGLISMEPRDRIKSVEIKGVYSHFYNERPMLEEDRMIEYQVKLELQWPERKEMPE